MYPPTPIRKLRTSEVCLSPILFAYRQRLPQEIGAPSHRPLPHADPKSSDVRNSGLRNARNSPLSVHVQTPHTKRQSLLPHAATTAHYFFSRRPTSCIRRAPSISSKELLEPIQSRRSSNVPHKLMQGHRDPMIQTIAHGDTTLLGLADVAPGCPQACLCRFETFP